MTQRKHRPISASALARTIQCPASLNFSKAFPNVPSEFAAEGTAAHELGEKALTQNKSPTDFLGIGIEAKPFNFVVTQEMVDAVTEYVEYVRLMHDIDKGSKLLIEQELFYDTEDFGGTADAIVLSSDKKSVHIIDYKHGKGIPVDAKDNAQLKTYALCASTVCDTIENVDLTVVQPRCERQECIHTSVSYSLAELKEWYAGIKDKLRYAVNLKVPKHEDFCTGEECGFCRAKGGCPAHAFEVSEALQARVDEPFNPIAVEALTDEQLTLIMVNKSKIEKFLTNVKEHVTGRMNSDKPVEGLKLVHYQNKKEWSSEQDVSQWIESHEEDEVRKTLTNLLTPRKLVTPTQALDICKKALKDTVEVPEHLITMNQTYSVVPLSDKRPAVSPCLDVGFEKE